MPFVTDQLASRFDLAFWSEMDEQREPPGAMGRAGLLRAIAFQHAGDVIDGAIMDRFPALALIANFGSAMMPSM